MRKTPSVLAAAILAAAPFAFTNSRNRAHDLALAQAVTFGIVGAAGSDWLDTTDAGLASFSTNFSTLISASPTTYGLDAATATALASANTTYQAALTLANAPSTRTSANIAAKDAAKSSLISIIRQDAKIVQATPSVSNDDRIALGLPINTDTPSTIPAPATFPLIAVIKASTLSHTIRYSDSETPDSARKPTDSIGMELYVQVSATPIVDPAAISYRGIVTRNPVDVAYDSADIGKQAYIVGRWINPRGEAGPWASIQSFTVAA